MQTNIAAMKARGTNDTGLQGSKEPENNRNQDLDYGGRTRSTHQPTRNNEQHKCTANCGFTDYITISDSR